jgi:exodeoxyribonuclease-3
MKLATWNINSVRLRIELVIAFLKESQTDVLCLQETKTEDKFFPADALAAAGWTHHAFRGEKSYNGVAIISRLPLSDIGHLDWVGKTDCRHISAQIEGGPLVHNFYVPAGGDVPDRVENPKFAHKLDFITEMTRYFSENAPKNAILVGDLNIAPLAEDVWSTKQLLKIISHTPVETDGLKKLIADGGWVDAVRQFYGPDEKIYSWWSYRSKDWSVNNRGRRLDHVWMSRDLVGALKAADISIDYRNAEKPSDHVPVIVEL